MGAKGGVGLNEVGRMCKDTGSGKERGHVRREGGERRQEEEDM